MDALLNILSENLPDAIKILGPAFFTAIVAIYTINKQSSANLRNQELQLRLKSREHIFEFYKSEKLRAEEGASKAIYACGELVGVMTALSEEKNESSNLSDELVAFLATSNTIAPLYSRKITKELSALTNDYSEFIDLLVNKTEELEKYPEPIPRSSHKKYARLLAEIFSLQSQCYSALMQIHAIDSLDDEKILGSR